MVQHPTAYSPFFEDPDYLVWKSLQTKSNVKQHKDLADVELAIRVAKTLVSKLKLPQNIAHFPNKDPDKPDFIFEGSGFHDPGIIIEWKNHIPPLAIPM